MFQTPRSRWYNNSWFVIFMLMPFVLGPFALPLLWKSPHFSRRMKTILTLLTVGLTIWLVVYVFTDIVPAITKQMNDLNSALQLY